MPDEERELNQQKAEELPPEEDEEQPAEPDVEPEPEAEEVTEATVEVPATVRRLTLHIGGAPTEKSAIARIWDGIQERIGGKSEAVGFKVYGDYWFARWSNSFQDRDGEWFAEKAHEDYIARVKMGVVKPPELWVEHIPGTRIGQAKLVSGIGHFVVAAGTFDNTPLGNAAKAYYQKHPMKGVSHGFVYDTQHYIDRVYNKYNSFEISPLRKKTPSNPWTTFKEVAAMKLTEKDLSILNEMFGEDVVQSEIIAKTEQASKALEEANVRFKEFIAPEPVVPESSEVTAKAERDFKQFLQDVVGDHAEVVQIAAAMSKAWDAEAAKVEAREKQRDETIKTLEGEIDKLRAEMRLRPRAASQTPETVLSDANATERGKQIIQTTDAQRKEVDTFWGTEVISNP